MPDNRRATRSSAAGAADGLELCGAERRPAASADAFASGAAAAASAGFAAASSAPLLGNVAWSSAASSEPFWGNVACSSAVDVPIELWVAANAS